MVESRKAASFESLDTRALVPEDNLSASRRWKPLFSVAMSICRLTMSAAPVKLREISLNKVA